MPISRRSFVKAAVAGGIGAARLANAAGARATRRPTNLVVIMTDNQGAWTLGCYGNRDIRTPHIDRLARDGATFTRAFSANAVCSPSRASFLTGLMPSQHGVHCWLAGGGAQTGPKAYCTIGELATLPKVLAEAGYACGLVGKWHLGGNLRPQEGFGYWITTPAGHTSTFYGAKVIEGGKVRTESGYLTDLWTAHAVRFLERQAKARKPFFLLLTYNGPYGLGASLNHAARNRHAAHYADKSLPSFPRGAVHPWLRQNRQFVNNVKAMRRYAAEVSGVDDGVGEVLGALKRLGCDDDTLVVYTADQGWSGGQHGIWGMADHTRPLHAFDETMRIPLIFRHRGSIPAGRRCDRMIGQYDLMPTLLSWLGLAEKMPSSPRSPGRDFTGLLRGGRIDWQDVIFYEFENTRVIRTADWKYVRRHPSGPNELYDLKSDPGETRSLVEQAAHEATRRDLQARLATFFQRYADPKYDLWRGGGSKSHLLTRSGRK